MLSVPFVCTRSCCVNLVDGLDTVTRDLSTTHIYYALHNVNYVQAGIGCGAQATAWTILPTLISFSRLRVWAIS
jgi:hypothetical protein